MPVCYIDCSPFMHTLLLADKLSHNELRVNVGDPAPGGIPALIGNSTVIINGHTWMDADLMDACPHLRSIVFMGTGASSYIDLAAARERNIVIRTIKGYGDRSIAEHTFALMLSAARRVPKMDAALRSGVWNPEAGIELAGSTLGVLGAGGVGGTVAQMAHTFGMRVLIWNRSVLAPPLVAMQADLDTVLTKSDVISLHLALNDQTRGFLDKDKLLRMKPGSMLINTARAELVDTHALIQQLTANPGISHAALDVYDTEPVDAEHPLLKLDNVTLSAHAAFKTEAASRRLLRQSIAVAAADLARIQQERALD